VPPERVTVLRRSFDAALADPEMIAEARRLGMELATVKGEDLNELVEELMSTPPDVLESVQSLSK
jgi:tripartite-type tricarboxylate transporter receptor subunit TctC